MDCFQCAKFVGCEECQDRGWLGCEEFKDDPRGRELTIELNQALCDGNKKGAEEIRVKLFNLNCERL